AAWTRCEIAERCEDRMGARTAPMAQATRRQRGSAWRVLPNYLFVLPYLVFFAVFSAGPLVYTIYMSFYNRGLFDTHPPFIGIGNYTELWSDPVWLISLGNTVEFVIVSVIFITRGALGAALLLRALPRWQTCFRSIFFAAGGPCGGGVAIFCDGLCG